MNLGRILAVLLLFSAVTGAADSSGIPATPGDPSENASSTPILLIELNQIPPAPGPKAPEKRIDLYLKALTFALKHDLGNTTAQEFAARAASHPEVPGVLERFEWAYSRYLPVPKDQKSDITENHWRIAAALAEHAALLPGQDDFHRYANAFEYASKKEYLGMDADQASLFADKFSNVSAEFLGAFRTAYASLKAYAPSSWTLKPEDLQQFADSVTRSPDLPEALHWQLWVLQNFPPKDGPTFQQALNLAQILSQEPSPGNQEEFVRIFRDLRAKNDSPPVASRRALSAANMPQLAPHSYYLNDVREPVAPQLSDEQLAKILNETTGSCYSPSNMPFDPSDPALQMGNEVSRLGPFEYPSALPPEIPPSIRNAARAFPVPEKYLACTAELESNFDNRQVSGTQATGTMQIEPETCSEIHGIIWNPQTGRDDLRTRWAAYTTLQARNDFPVMDSPRASCDALSHDSNWSIGASALLTTQYSEDFFGKTPRELDADDLAMTFGLYNAGVGGMKFAGCQPGKIVECLQALLRKGNTQTFCHILKASNCLHNRTPLAGISGQCSHR